MSHARLPEGHWADVGRRLNSVERSVMWWLGDWWAYGERKGYGERKKVVEAEGWDGPAYQTCRDAAWVARSFEPSQRRDNVPWSTHKELAGISERGDRFELLARAEAERWTVREAKAQVGQRKAAAAIGSSSPDEGICTVADLWSLVERGQRFGAIYADPPWLYDNQGTRAATGNDYGYRLQAVQQRLRLPAITSFSSSVSVAARRTS